jgi:hypothetical protein
MNPLQRKQNQTSITKYFTPQPSENTSQENSSSENETPQDLNPSDEKVDSQSSEDIKNDKIKNKGTGAGGANTNANGKKLEERIRSTISKNIEVIGPSIEFRKTKKNKVEDIKYKNKNYIRAPEGAFELYEEKKGESKIPKAHGAKRPDDAIINKATKIMTWMESKAQTGNGSVTEKLQTATEKIENLRRRFPEWNINYVYILSSYFRKGAPYEISRLKEKNILYIFDDDEDFEIKLMDYAFK